MYLGVDIGTSKIALAMVDARGTVRVVRSVPHQAQLRRPPGRAEQCPHRIASCVRSLVRSLPVELRRQVRAIGVTGQMHGVLLADRSGQPLTPFVTWQDARALVPDANWPGRSRLRWLQRHTGVPVQAGYGLATLDWWRAHSQWPRNAAWVVTIADWLVWDWCELSRPIMDETMAAAWGIWDMVRRRISLRGPLRCLRAVAPEVRPMGMWAGTLGARTAREWGVAAGVPVMLATGDNQASVYATIHHPHEEIALTIGTGAQISVVVDRPGRPPLGASWESRPYRGRCALWVAASLNGGAAWAAGAAMLRRWCSQLTGVAPKLDRMLAAMNRLGLRARQPWRVVPVWSGERFAPELRGEVHGIGLQNMDVGSFARGLAEGIVRNLQSLLPAGILQGRTRVVGSGNALRRNALLRRAVREAFGCPLRLTPFQEEAAVGAAKLARDAEQNSHDRGH